MKTTSDRHRASRKPPETRAERVETLAMSLIERTMGSLYHIHHGFSNEGLTNHCLEIAERVITAFDRVCEERLERIRKAAATEDQSHPNTPAATVTAENP